MRYKHKHGHGPFPYCKEEKELTRKREEYAEEALEEEEEHAARVAKAGNMNPRVKSVSLWTLHGKKKY